MKDNKFYYSDGTTSVQYDFKKIIHRLDGPAIEYANGRKYWYQNGKLHRTDGPAIEFANGDKHWLQHGQYHKTDGPAIEYTNGTVHWFVRGKEIKFRPMTVDRLQKILVLL